MVRLWLFDIDGVLVYLTGDVSLDPHLKAYQSNYKTTLGIDVSAKTIRSKYGMSEVETHRAVLDELGVAYDDELLERLAAAQLPNLVEALKGIPVIEPLEGVVEFLGKLKENNEYLGVVTGNFTESADVLLGRSGLRDYFSIVSCDDGSLDRHVIVENAIDQAKQLGYEFDSVVVVGDTVHDVEAAKLYARRSEVPVSIVAVATGSDSYKKLADSQPTITVHNLKDYNAVVEALK
jgi:HAD superfamily hydrolase (TIGR01549 family)